MKIEKKPCSHCGAEPSDADVERAVAAYLYRQEDDPCAVCGEAFELASAQLFHRTDNHPGTIWVLGETMIEPCVQFHFMAHSGVGGPEVRHSHGRVHVRCAAKVFPKGKPGQY